MKVLHLSFLNLNSLAGEWSIDFTRPDYATEGIFAITGATGSGKTTILDALCLALYGQTPRLGKITKSGNELMTRHTGECFAEVVFATDKGSYRCRWSQRRARKRPDGELQLQKHEISDALTDHVIHARVQDTMMAVEELTGMDFDRFTRSMLLAQGGFSAFLQAEPDRRAPVLEQITGTAIYSQISIRVHERQREERSKLELLKAETEGIRVPGQDEMAALRCRMEERIEAEHQQELEHRKVTEALRWREGLQQLENELAGIGAEADIVSLQRMAFVPEEKRLQTALLAASVDHIYQPLFLQRQEQERATGALLEKERLRPGTDEALSLAGTVFTEAGQRLQALLASEKAARALFGKVRSLDVQIQEKITAQKRLQREFDDTTRRFKENSGKKSVTTAQLEAKHQELSALQLWLEEHRIDAGLGSELSGMEQSIKQLQSSIDREIHAGRAEADARRRHQDALEGQALRLSACRRAEMALGKSRKKSEELRGRCDEVLDGRSLKELRATLDTLKSRSILLVELAVAYETGKGINHQIESINLELEDFSRQLAAMADRCTGLLALQRSAEREVASCERELLFVNRIRSLEEERMRLADGTPCPLCGSIHHPYASGALPLGMDDAEAHLQKAKAELQTHLDGLNMLARTEVGIRKERELRECTLKESAGKRDELRHRCRELLAEAGIAVPARDALPEVLSARDNVAGQVTGLARRIEQAEVLEEELFQAEERQREQLDAFSTARNQLEQAAQLVESTDTDIQRTQQDHLHASAERDSQLESLQATLALYGSAISLGGDHRALIAGLKERSRLWQEREMGRRGSEQRVSALETTLNELEVQHEIHLKELGDKANVVKEAQSILDALQDERRQLFGEKNPEDEETRMELLVAEARDADDHARQVRDDAHRQLHALDMMITSLRSGMEERQKLIDRCEGAFRAGLDGAGFSDEAAFLDARLSADACERLTEQSRELRQKEYDCDARRKDRTVKLRDELEKKLTERSAAGLSLELDTLQEGLRQVRGEIGAIGQQLDASQKAAALQLEKAEARTAQEVECRRWDLLHELIGSADGKKFRNFAQGLTFDIMVAQANRQLVKMTTRYLLVRDSKEPLELNVIDSYQAGEIRSTRNLSGGECFIVSLALALGLSHMASRNVRVDSLFLDEGFGTLDEEALETALETLSGLQQSGKLIGIISHVPALKERIATQIRVSPLTGGRSALAGPGVTFVQVDAKLRRMQGNNLPAGE